jgi:hypothetical protein
LRARHIEDAKAIEAFMISALGQLSPILVRNMTVYYRPFNRNFGPRGQALSVGFRQQLTFNLRIGTTGLSPF